ALPHLFSRLLPRTMLPPPSFSYNHTAPTDIHTLSLHDALPICLTIDELAGICDVTTRTIRRDLQALEESGFPLFDDRTQDDGFRSEEHTSELQSRGHLVCRLLLEKKKKQ